MLEMPEGSAYMPAACDMPSSEKLRINQEAQSRMPGAESDCHAGVVKDQLALNTGIIAFRNRFVLNLFCNLLAKSWFLEPQRCHDY